MGKGIAVDFKRKFGKVQDLIDQNKVVGEVALLKHKERFVYYLVTKERCWNKPTYQSLTSSLEKMRDHAINSGVKMICMPKIGNYGNLILSRRESDAACVLTKTG
jgi:hypothetical protein